MTGPLHVYVLLPSIRTRSYCGSLTNGVIISEPGNQPNRFNKPHSLFSDYLALMQIPYVIQLSQNTCPVFECDTVKGFKSNNSK